jgi:hypothetical protein
MKIVPTIYEDLGSVRRYPYQYTFVYRVSTGIKEKFILTNVINRKHIRSERGFRDIRFCSRILWIFKRRYCFVLVLPNGNISIFIFQKF